MGRSGDSIDAEKRSEFYNIHGPCLLHYFNAAICEDDRTPLIGVSSSNIEAKGDWMDAVNSADDGPGSKLG